MASFNEPALEWPRFCYTGKFTLHCLIKLHNDSYLTVSYINSFIGPSLFEDEKITPKTHQQKTSRKRKSGPNNNSNNGGVVKRAKTAKLPLLIAAPEKEQRVPNLDLNDFTYSNLMRKMAQKYQDVADDSGSDRSSSPQSSLSSSSSPPHVMQYPCFNPFMPPFLPHSFNALLSTALNANCPLDLTKENEEIDVVGTTTSPSSTAAKPSIDHWDVLRVARFVSDISGCAEYQQVSQISSTSSPFPNHLQFHSFSNDNCHSVQSYLLFLFVVALDFRRLLSVGGCLMTVSLLRFEPPAVRGGSRH